MTIIKSMVADMRADSAMLEEMRGVYPGDITGSLGLDAYLLNKAASWLERIDWEKESQLYVDNLPEITVTYTNDNDKEQE